MKQCAVKGCDLAVSKRGWCNRHYLRWKRHGDPLAGGALRPTGPQSEQPWAGLTVCTATDCTNPPQHRGLCRGHYMKWYRHGDPNRQQSPTPRGFWQHLTVTALDECWIWQGGLNEKGYGKCGPGPGRQFSRRAHRRMYEMAYGPVPPDVDIDHTCNERACCNPAHLEAVNHAENIRRRDARHSDEPGDVAAIGT